MIFILIIFMIFKSSIVFKSLLYKNRHKFISNSSNKIAMVTVRWKFTKKKSFRGVNFAKKSSKGPDNNWGLYFPPRKNIFHPLNVCSSNLGKNITSCIFVAQKSIFLYCHPLRGVGAKWKYSYSSFSCKWVPVWLGILRQKGHIGLLWVLGIQGMEIWIEQTWTVCFGTFYNILSF